MTAAAWTWVMEHGSSVDRIAARIARQSGADAEDLRSSTIIRLVEKFDRFDSRKGSAETWIWWTAREVATTTRRRSIPTAEVDVESMAKPPQIEARLDARRIVSKASRMATETQAMALTSIVEGWSGEEVRERLGCSMPTRNARVYRLRDRLQKVAT